MKKTILSIAIMVAALAGTTTISAQTPANGDTNAQEQRGSRRQAPKVYNPFENLGLTQQQMNDLKALSDSQREKAKETRQKDQKPEERMAQLEQERKDNLAKIKAILTPEQYVQFLENCYLNPPNQRLNGGRQGRTDGQRGQRGERGQRGPRGNFGQMPD